MSGKIDLRWHEFSPEGGTRECFCSAEAEPGAFPDFASEFAALWNAYEAKLAASGLTPRQELLLRFHLLRYV